VIGDPPLATEQSVADFERPNGGRQGKVGAELRQHEVGV
jgi:hypothetical protein